MASSQPAVATVFGLTFCWRRLLPKRPNMRVILMSATLRADTFASYFGEGTPRLHIGTSMYPVQTFYLEDALKQTPDDEALLLQHHQHAAERPSSSSAERHARRDAAKAAREVRACLKPFYTAGRITSREDFKHLARELTRKLHRDAKERVWNERMEAKVRKYVDRAFAGAFVYERGKERADG